MAVAVGSGRVGVLGRVEPAAGLAQVAQHVLDRLGDDLPPARLVEGDGGVGVDAHQQRLVVEHLLEVRHEPLAVDRVAGEAAADVVVHAARRHRVERRRDDPCARRSDRPTAGAPAARGRGSSSTGTSAPRRTRPTRRRTLAASACTRARRRARRPAAPSAGSQPGRARQRLAERGRRSCRARRGGCARRRRSPPSAAGSSASGSRCRRRTARPSGVRNTVIGQPPRPVIACTASM